MLTSKNKNFLSSGTRKTRSSQRRRNKSLPSSSRLIRRPWTRKFCQKPKVFLSSRAISALHFVSQMEFILTNWCFKFLT
uniref:Uncharacterized protein n=1 Tax=Capra hircus TaxID=9925 RepID=A0A8C2SM28_CAPHI